MWNQYLYLHFLRCVCFFVDVVVVGFALVSLYSVFCSEKQHFENWFESHTLWIPLKRKAVNKNKKTCFERSILKMRNIFYIKRNFIWNIENYTTCHLIKLILAWIGIIIRWNQCKKCDCINLNGILTNAMNETAMIERYLFSRIIQWE